MPPKRNLAASLKGHVTRKVENRPRYTSDVGRRGRQVKVMGISTPLAEAEWIDAFRNRLLEAGVTAAANRSFVVIEAIRDLRDRLDPMSPEELQRYFIDRRSLRRGSSAAG